MTNSEIKQVLLCHGVQQLYHTNTVETSLSFIKNGGLLSRGVCDDMGYPQTRQYTDKTDKLYNIYYDIFFDSMEIQRRTGVSYYGPVLFVYDIDVLNTIEEGNIHISKLNPDKWRNTVCESERYFLDLNEFSLFYNENDFGQHIILANQTKPLSFDYLEKIVISDPQTDDNSIFENAEIALRGALENAQLSVPFIIRDYSYNDRFFNTYASSQKLKEHYCLGGHQA